MLATAPFKVANWATARPILIIRYVSEAFGGEGVLNCNSPRAVKRRRERKQPTVKPLI